MINDPLYIASSNRPGMVLTNTPFNGSKFHGWSRNVRMALGAKLKLLFIDGSCPKPDVGDVELQRWIRCEWYHDWYKGKKAKKQNMIAANVSAGFDEHFSADIPFDMGSENEIGLNQRSGFDQKLVADVCQEMMRKFKGKGANSGASRDPIAFSASISNFHASYLDSVPSTRLTKESFSIVFLKKC
ncbi:retrovirus-related pol polyprotein from transposon TNT 1-94 [Tanacetum coccineum]